jgi:hypothetical protein
MLRCYGILCAALLPIVAAVVILIDPYDSGRFTPFDRPGVARYGQALTAASLGRQPEFTAAIIGNSTIQAVRPNQLDRSTGLRFVSLASPGTGPAEQSAIAEWFLRHHPAGGADEAKALVFGLDREWCRSDGNLPIVNPFPFWLYDPGAAAYLVGLLQLGSTQAVAGRVNILLGLEAPMRGDGYRPIDNGQARDPAAAARAFAEGYRRLDPHRPIDRAALPRMRKLLHEAPAAAAVVLVFPPRHYSSLPPPGSEEARAESECKESFRKMAAERPGTAVVDLAVDGEIARDDKNFFDQIHYRNPIAQIVEDKIAAALLHLVNRNGSAAGL